MSGRSWDASDETFFQHRKTMKRSILFLLSALLLSACDKAEKYAGEEAVVCVAVVDENGSPLAGIPVKLYDEPGAAAFEKDNTAAPHALLLTDAAGQAEFRFQFREWFTAGSRQMLFVVQEGGGPDNYRIWSAERTLEAGQRLRVELRLECRPFPERVEVLDMFDEAHGLTLFGGSVYIDSSHNFVGSDRCSFVDVGPVAEPGDIGQLRLDGLTDRVAVEPGHGYHIVRDIALMEFPSGSWALLVGAEHARLQVVQWIYHDGAIVGARVRYSISRVEGAGLPPHDELFVTGPGDARTVLIPLPARDGDYELAAAKMGSLEFTVVADEATVRVIAPEAVPGSEYALHIRCGSCYTRVKVCVAHPERKLSPHAAQGGFPPIYLHPGKSHCRCVRESTFRPESI